MKIISILLISILLSINCYATHEVIIEVIQPNIQESGITKTHTTYSRMTVHPGGYYLSLTFAENSIETTHGRENKNIASMYNFELKILRNSYTYGTIEVELILPENIKELEYKDGYSIEKVLEETIDCLVQNASVFYSDLDLKITGDVKYSKFEKIYSTKTNETRERNKYLSIQIKSFPIEELKEALVFYNSFREIGLMTFMEKGIVNEKEFLRIKIGYFDNMKDAELVGHILKKTKGVDFFITNFSGTITNYKGMHKIINTPSGIWIKGSIKEKEIFNFIDETNLSFNQNEIDISHDILKINSNEKEIEINLKELTRKF